MRKNVLGISLILTACVIFLTSPGLYAEEDKSTTKPGMRIRKAALVIDEFMNSPDRGAAAALMRNSAAVAVFPAVYKGALIIGGQYGKGVMCSYDKKTGTWSAPAFFTIGGGSIGFQIGGQAIALILVIINERGLESLLKGKVTLGGDVSVAAGPVGRQAQAETDVLLKAEIYSYSRTKGAFIGIALKGAVVAPDKDDNYAYYGNVWFPKEILIDRKVEPTGPALDLVKALAKFAKE